MSITIPKLRKKNTRKSKNGIAYAEKTSIKGRRFSTEGVAWYQKKFYFEGGTMRLNFGAVLTEANVYLDGNHIGYHYGGFSQFDFIVNGVEAGEHTLTVKVDNRFDFNSIPQKRVDWYHYGGITRDVTVEKLSGISSGSLPI